MISFITLLAASAALASPIERQAKTAILPLKRVSNFTSVKNLVSKGQDRLYKVNSVSAISDASEVGSGSVTNEDVSYVAPVSIGGTTYQLIVDTGCTLLLLRDSRNALLTRYPFQLQTPGVVPKAHASRAPQARVLAARSRSAMVAAHSLAQSTQILSASEASLSHRSQSALQLHRQALPASMVSLVSGRSF